MNTSNSYTHTLMIILIFALIFSGCRAQDKQYEAAKVAAVTLLANSALPGISNGWMNPIYTGNALWAIDQALASKPGAYMMLHQAKQIAVFVSPGVKDYATHTSYWLWWFINLNTGRLIDAGKQLPNVMGQSVNAKTMGDVEKLLIDNGFTKLSPAALPTLATTLRMALEVIKGMGSSTIQLLVAPGSVLTPDWFYNQGQVDWIDS